jgi:D-arabinose 1-dehydrogenase-like Zn-dependent alcohol dehydrogenase
VSLVQRRPCGTCDECHKGWTQLCRRGKGFYGDDIQGGYAEFVLADPQNAVPIPDSIDDATAAILSCGVGTGLHALKTAEVGAGDVVLITGASGGIGLHAVQLATVMGAKVIATTSSERNAKSIRDAGADVVLVRPDLSAVRAAARTLGRARGVDSALEVTGLPTFSLSLRSLGPRGRLVLIGNVDPAELPLDPGLTIVKELRILGSAHANREDLREVVDLVASGRVVPQVSQTFALADVSAAHRAHENHELTGRVVLLPRHELDA